MPFSSACWWSCWEGAVRGLSLVLIQGRAISFPGASCFHIPGPWWGPEEGPLLASCGLHLWEHQCVMSSLSPDAVWLASLASLFHSGGLGNVLRPPHNGSEWVSAPRPGRPLLVPGSMENGLLASTPGYSDLPRPRWWGGERSLCVSWGVGPGLHPPGCVCVCERVSAQVCIYVGGCAPLEAGC